MHGSPTSDQPWKQVNIYTDTYHQCHYPNPWLASYHLGLTLFPEAIPHSPFNVPKFRFSREISLAIGQLEHYFVSVSKLNIFLKRKEIFFKINKMKHIFRN